MLPLDLKALELDIERIEDKASELGLDFFDMKFVLCTPEEMSFIGAYGMTGRFSHWIFGRDFYKLYLRHRLGLVKVHELVVNSDPCIAFLLKGNTILENKMAVAHAFAHSDFFKNNIHYSHDPKTVLRFFAENHRLLLEYEECYGKQRVEKFLEAVLALRSLYFSQGLRGDDKGFQRTGEEDIYLYLCRKSEVLESWQREIIHRLRGELEYFRSLARTRIINEGWAAFWHTRILRELDLPAEEAVEFAVKNAETLSHEMGEINLYLFGKEIFTALEKELGIKEIFRIRRRENDLGFIEKYLSLDLIKKLGLFFYRKGKSGVREIVSDPAIIKKLLLRGIYGCWHPLIVIAEGEEDNNELCLRHQYDGRQRNSYYAKKTLELIHLLWGETVSLETFWEGRPVVFIYSGKEHILRNK
ncbi:MAG: SpoVR family protein [Clostridia bacterium]|nr:SpoVR family protein [Clostridia bacterium]